MDDFKQILLRKVPKKIYEKVLIDKLNKDKNLDEVIIEILEKHYGF